MDLCLQENTGEKSLGARLRKTRSRTKDAEQAPVIKEAVKEDRSTPDVQGTPSTEPMATSEKYDSHREDTINTTTLQNGRKRNVNSA